MSMGGRIARRRVARRESNGLAESGPEFVRASSADGGEALAFGPVVGRQADAIATLSDSAEQEPREREAERQSEG